MRKTYAYFTSILLVFFCSLLPSNAQDTVLIPLKIKVGLEVSGPGIYFSDKNILNAEGYISVDRNEKMAFTLNAGYLDYKYSQYNYNYLNRGSFLRAGVDFNLLKPKKSQGKYWAGVGLRYGLSVYNSEVPSFKKENYWGTVFSSVGSQTNWAHFIEVSPGVRADVLKNLSIGWTVSLRKLIYSGSGNDLKPIYLPGYGNTGKSLSTGITYFIVWNIPFKKINVIIKKEEPEETDNEGDADNSANQGTTTPGTNSSQGSQGLM